MKTEKMEMKTRQNGMYMLLVVVAALVAAFIYGSCSSDENFWELDGEGITKECTRAEVMDMSEYLTLSTYDDTRWTKKDYQIVDIAETRMGIVFKNNRYTFSASCGHDINISDSLYQLLRSEYELTNSILNGVSNNRIVRRKSRDPESQSIPNCVPVALYNMGQNSASSVQEAESICTLYDRNWRTHGGVYTNLVKLIIEEFTSVTERVNITDSDSITDFNKCVMLIPSSIPEVDHAVNAKKYIKKKNGSAVITYVDYWKGGVSGRLSASGMTYIYTFD